MEIISVQGLKGKQKREIVELWNAEYPEALHLSGVGAFDEYLGNLSDKHHLIIANKNRVVVGWLMYFVRDNEQCFAMILDSSIQGRGMGSELLNKAKSYNSELNGWVIDNNEQLKQNGTSYKSPIDFYRKNGFEIFPEVRLKKKNIDGIKVRWTKASFKAGHMVMFLTSSL